LVSDVKDSDIIYRGYDMAMQRYKISQWVLKNNFMGKEISYLQAVR